MLTKEDKEFLTESFATKADITELKVESTLLQQTVQRLDQDIERIEEKIDKLITIGDGNAGNIADLQQENKMGAVTLHRHGIQIHELATATGTAISE